MVCSLGKSSGGHVLNLLVLLESSSKCSSCFPNVRMSELTMASYSGCRQSPVPHTRIEDEVQMEEVYIIGKKLGEGNFGIVRKVVHKETNVPWACKAVNKEKAGSSKIRLLEREVDILKKVHHEHIIRLKEVLETPKKMYLIMEYCSGGELADVLKAKKRFSEIEAKTIIERLASAIGYLHKKGMVHRDIKLENILMAQNPKDKNDKLYIKVTDFGLSVMKGVGHDSMMMDFCGTPMYMAPEIIDNKTYSEMCDIWAMGVITYMLLSGVPPFYSRKEGKLYHMIKTVDVKSRLNVAVPWSNISPEAKDCIIRMMHPNPAHRMSAHEVLDCAWISGSNHTRPPNVLQLMKEWGKNDQSALTDDENEVEDNIAELADVEPTNDTSPDTVQACGMKTFASTQETSSDCSEDFKLKDSDNGEAQSVTSVLQSGSKKNSPSIGRNLNCDELLLLFLWYLRYIEVGICRECGL
ncbi:Serine/threonine-protein kinase 33 [Lamellibrachia satsuma]|nr:Serine/threonine-protein kinase 33 [Lamellibrachia satsuma]